MRRSTAELSQMLEFSPPGCCRSTRRVRAALWDPSPRPPGCPGLFPPAGDLWCARPA